MKKLFNNSTKGNDTQNQTSKSKRKFLKTFSFTSLAFLMGIVGTFTFAPLGANPNALATASETEYTTEQGLITPTADDPTLYTTESGLDIKFGLATPPINASLPSGNLKGFPYFTTTKSSTTYTWVIIGRGENTDFWMNEMRLTLFSLWKESPSAYTFGNYFFKNIYETTTPAGNAINSTVLNKSFVVDEWQINLSNLPKTDEIGSNNVLCLLNSIPVTSGYASSSEDSTNFYSNTSNAVRSKCEGFYSNDTFGFGSLLSSLQNITVSQGNVYNPPAWSWSQNSVSNQKFFPLNADYSYPGTSNFKYTTYLTSSQFALGTTFWTRGHSGNGAPFYINESGAEERGDKEYSSSWTTARGIRPACVISLA